MATDLLSADLATAPNRATRGAEGEMTVAAVDLAGNRPAMGSSAGLTGAERGAAAIATAADVDGCPPTLTKVLADYLQLTKPRIVVMILVTTIATAIIGAGSLVPGLELLALLLGTGLVASSAGAANQVWERDIDQRMTRTAKRPLPSQRLAPLQAAFFTAVIGIAGSGILWFGFGPAPAVAGLVTWLMYVVVYTPMKTRTAWNTTVGAIAGALPMLIGYTAMGGSLSALTPWLLVGVLVAWQYPHFMAIAWMYRRQYDEAGFRMTTTVEPTGHSAGWQSIVGSLAVIVCGVTLCMIPAGLVTGLLGSVAVTLVTYPMLRASIRFAASPEDATARKLLRSSLLVLPAVLLVVTLRVFW